MGTFTERLQKLLAKRRSLLCVGLDVDLTRLPAGISATPAGVRRFCAEIIAATAPYAVAYKVNFAFFESMGTWGWELLATVRAAVPHNMLALADAKRGDVAHTNAQYARAVFDVLGYDALTVHPYLGGEALLPFLERAEHGVFVLCRTSNPGAGELQDWRDQEERPLYQTVAQCVRRWNTRGNCGLVVGATYPTELAAVRQVAPELPLLLPGVGAQAGDLAAALAAAGASAPVLVAASRSILYASSGSDFAAAAAHAAAALHSEIQTCSPFSP